MVKKWHEMIVEKSIVNKKASTSIYNHVKVDTDLGHLDNWENILNKLNFIEVGRLTKALNCISLVAEMFYRWLDSLNSSNYYECIKLLSLLKSEDLTQHLTQQQYKQRINYKGIFSATLLDNIVHGSDSSSYSPNNIKFINFIYGTSELISLNVPDLSIKLTQSSINNSIVKSYLAKFTYQTPNHPNLNIKDKIKKIALSSWMNAINGHKLWSLMLEKTSYNLIFGWILENYFYISAIHYHVSAAIASCTDINIRTILMKHLKEEFKHGEIFKQALANNFYALDIKLLRPLATTVTFIGSIIDLARRDWKSYCIALFFLQKTLSSEKSESINKFYENITNNCPDASNLILAMKTHDIVDQNLNHDHEADDLLNKLCNNEISHENIDNAALVAELLWSFLDGIKAHYQHGNMSVFQRIGWHYD